MGKLANAFVAAAAVLLMALVIVEAKSNRADQPIPYGAGPLYALAVSAESQGNAAEAERLLKHAVAIDRGSLPRWTLANFYLRHENEGAWPLLKEAIAIAIHGGQDVSGMFETAWQFRPDPAFLLRNLAVGDPTTVDVYLSFLLTTGRTQALVQPSLLTTDKRLQLQAADALLTTGNIALAKRVWDRAVPPRSGGELLVNPELRTPRLLGFDWRFNSVSESPVTFGDGMRVEFTGRQPELLELLIQTVQVGEGDYSFSWESKSRSETGVSWQATDPKSGTMLFRASVHSNGNWQPQRAEFRLRTANAIRLVLYAERLPGASRYEGTFWLRNPSLRLR